MLSQIHGCGFEIEQYILGIGIGFYFEKGSGCVRVVDIDECEVIDAFFAVFALADMAVAIHQQVNMLYCLALS